jgi:hypothetical protein
MTYFIFVNNNLQTKPVVHRLLPTYLQFAIIYQVSNLKSLLTLSMQYTSYLGQKPHGQKSPRHKPQDKSHLDKKNLGQKPPDKKKPNNE